MKSPAILGRAKILYKSLACCVLFAWRRTARMISPWDEQYKPEATENPPTGAAQAQKLQNSVGMAQATARNGSLTHEVTG